MIQVAAKSESVPVIAQEFTKLFTVVALKDTTDLTNLTKCLKQTTGNRDVTTNEPESLLISNTNISCATWYG